jgi:hypothetical protein
MTTKDASFPFTEGQAILVQPLVILQLDCNCNSLLAGLPACAIQPLQLIQKAAVRLVFNLPTFLHTTLLLHPLRWQPVAAGVQFKSLVLASHAANCKGPSYIQDKVRQNTQLLSLEEGGPSCRSTNSRLFAVLAQCWWTELTTTYSSLVSKMKHMKQFASLNKQIVSCFG